MRLGKVQGQQLAYLTRTAISASGPCRTTLLVGPRGAGKRAIARRAAAELDLEFVEVSLQPPSIHVRRALFGTVQRGESDVTSGEALRSTPTLLFLSRLELADPELFHELARLVQDRRLRIPGGDEVEVAESVWLMGSLTSPVYSPTVSPEHWISTRFDLRVRIEAPSDPPEMMEIARSMASSIGAGFSIDDDCEAQVATARSSTDHLHRLKSWVEDSARQAGGRAALRASDFDEAMSLDLSWHLSRLRYRGQPMSETAVREWVNQFPLDLRLAALEIVKLISARYFISSELYHLAIDELLKRAQLRRGARVSFCRWQETGCSADRVASELKSQAGWKIGPEIDLRRDSEEWPDLAGGNVSLVIADDLIGSGGTFAGVAEGDDSPTDRLMREYPECILRVFVLAAFDVGLGRLRDALRHHGDRVEILVWRLLDDRDRAFTDISSVISRSETRDAFRHFCLAAAANEMRLQPRLALGFDATASILVFHDHVPNNSLPVLWHDSADWIPLFPRSGLPWFAGE